MAHLSDARVGVHVRIRYRWSLRRWTVLRLPCRYCLGFALAIRWRLNCSATSRAMCRINSLTEALASSAVGPAGREACRGCFCCMLCPCCWRRRKKPRAVDGARHDELHNPCVICRLATTCPHAAWGRNGTADASAAASSYHLPAAERPPRTDRWYRLHPSSAAARRRSAQW